MLVLKGQVFGIHRPQHCPGMAWYSEPCRKNDVLPEFRPLALADESRNGTSAYLRTLGVTELSLTVDPKDIGKGIAGNLTQASFTEAGGDHVTRLERVPAGH